MYRLYVCIALPDITLQLHAVNTYLGKQYVLVNSTV